MNRRSPNLGDSGRSSNLLANRKFKSLGAQGAGAPNPALCGPYAIQAIGFASPGETESYPESPGGGCGSGARFTASPTSATHPKGLHSGTLTQPPLPASQRRRRGSMTNPGPSRKAAPGAGMTATQARLLPSEARPRPTIVSPSAEIPVASVRIRPPRSSP
jgi:hypothetical protein